MKLVIVLSAFVIATVAQASTDQRATSFVLCKNQKAVRTIRVMPNEKGCITTYSKSGIDEVVEENRSADSCKSRLKTIQEHLEASQWECRSVDKAEVTYSGEVQNTVIR